MRRGTHRGRTRGRDWWTLGFEASGPADLLRGALGATAVFVFTISLPGGEARSEECRSYAQWLSQWPGTADEASG